MQNSAQGNRVARILNLVEYLSTYLDPLFRKDPYRRYFLIIAYLNISQSLGSKSIVKFRFNRCNRDEI